MPAAVDIFNGDADGILSLHQLRLDEPRDATLVTGPKRDIELLDRVAPDQPALLTVLDISMESNHARMLDLLERGHDITWFDHHRPGDIPAHPRLHATIDTSPHVCTAMLVDRQLAGRFRHWAIAAAFGDNLRAVARGLAAQAGLPADEVDMLETIGTTLNYNAYGESTADLVAAPAEVYRDLQKYREPREYFSKSALFNGILRQKCQDESDMKTSRILHHGAATKCVLLPVGPASARLSGIYSNDLVEAEPRLAHAIFTRLQHMPACRVSIRAPLDNPRGADELAVLFGGGGRPRAAGINALAESEFDAFFAAMDGIYR